jgi:hypothetical protein
MSDVTGILGNEIGQTKTGRVMYAMAKGVATLRAQSPQASPTVDG